MEFILYILCGGIAGWLATKIMSGKSSGVFFSVILGIVGGVVGGFAFRFLGLQTTNMIGELLTATAGAIITIYVVRVIRE